MPNVTPRWGRCGVCASPVPPTRRFCSVGCSDLRRSATALAAFAGKRGPHKSAYLKHLRVEVTAGRYRIPTSLIAEGILTWHGRDGFLTDDDCRRLLEGVPGA